MEEVTYHLVADKGELEQAFAIRSEVFVKEQGIPSRDEYDGLDTEALHVLAKYKGQVIGTARVRFLSASQAKIERMAVLKAFRRRGVGGGMVSFLNEELRRRQVTEVVLHAQYAVAGFYRLCRFEECGEPFLEVGIKHIEMRKRL